MILESFDRHTIANLEVALDRVCDGRPDGADHELRSFIADAMVACAKKGQTTLGALTEAGEAALARLGYLGQKTGLSQILSCRAVPGGGGFLACARQPAPYAQHVDHEKNGVLDDERTFRLQYPVGDPRNGCRDKEDEAAHGYARVPVRRHHGGRDYRHGGCHGS